MAFNKLSLILGPMKTGDPSLVNAKDMISKSGKLFSDKGLVRLSDGKPTLLPLVVRAKRKLENIIREEMDKISACEISLPILTKESLLEKTGRSERPELFKLSDKACKKYILSATNEETVTDLLSKEKLHERSLPVRFYQINTKFRDEIDPKYSLIRLKEFVMKDLYCFDSCPEFRDVTYNDIVQQYYNIFKRLQLPFVCVKSDGSHIACVDSHEFHFLADIGEDEIIICKKCGENVNVNMAKNINNCPNCLDSNINIEKGIEVGHTFNIGTVYSKMLKANFYNKNGELKPLELSSYGIGITRILGASVEMLSTKEQLRWPLPISPYLICIIPPKLGSKEEKALEGSSKDICIDLNKHFKGDVVIDDRSMYTIGRRLILDKDLGFPFIVIIGKEMLHDPPKIEIFDVCANKMHLIHPSDAVGFISSKILEHE